MTNFRYVVLTQRAFRRRFLRHLARQPLSVWLIASSQLDPLDTKKSRDLTKKKGVGNHIDLLLFYIFIRFW